MSLPTHLLRTALPGQPAKHSEQGLTLLECLMAIVVIGLTMAVIAPPLLISAATRVQNRRAEQALQIAQGEVDRIRAMVARDEHIPGRLPATVTPAGGNLQAVPAPGTAPSAFFKSPRGTCAGGSYNGQQVPANQTLRIDVDGDCNADFLMQMFRTPGNTNNAEIIGNTNRPADFQMGVRVYSILADGSAGPLETLPASLQLTSGQGKQRTRPLAVIYTPFSRSDQADSLCFYQSGQNLGASCN
jgi:prepilin-type N-terminal cleavage/methylation domain-containing protein